MAQALRDWYAPFGAKPGGQRRYSKTAIEVALTVRSEYGLALRQIEGFLRSIARIMQLNVDISDHSTLSRRSANLEPHLPKAASAEGSVHVLIEKLPDPGPDLSLQQHRHVLSAGINGHQSRHKVAYAASI